MKVRRTAPDRVDESSRANPAPGAGSESRSQASAGSQAWAGLKVTARNVGAGDEELVAERQIVDPSARRRRSRRGPAPAAKGDSGLSLSISRPSEFAVRSTAESAARAIAAQASAGPCMLTTARRRRGAVRAVTTRVPRLCKLRVSVVPVFVAAVVASSLLGSRAAQAPVRRVVDALTSIESRGSNCSTWAVLRVCVFADSVAMPSTRLVTRARPSPAHFHGSHARAPSRSLLSLYSRSPVFSASIDVLLPGLAAQRTPTHSP